MSDVNDYLNDEVRYWRERLEREIRRRMEAEAERDQWIEVANRGFELCAAAVAALKAAENLIELYGCCNPN